MVTLKPSQTLLQIFYIGWYLYRNETRTEHRKRIIQTLRCLAVFLSQIHCAQVHQNVLEDDLDRVAMMLFLDQNIANGNKLKVKGNLNNFHHLNMHL